MKKQIAIIIIAIILLIGIIPVYSKADGEKGTTVNLTISNQNLQKPGDTFEIIVSLGNFNGIQENSMLGLSGEFNYNSAMFELVEQEGLNGWTLTTGKDKFEIDTNSAKPQTEIAKFTFKLKDELKNGVEGNIEFKNLVLSDGDNYLIVDGRNSTALNKTFTVSYLGETTITNDTKNDQPNQQKDDTKQNTTTQNTASSTNTANTNSSTSGTNTISKNAPINNVSKNTVSGAVNNTTSTNILSRLPAAGKGRLAIIIIALIALAVFFRIKARKIKY